MGLNNKLTHRELTRLIECIDHRLRARIDNKEKVNLRILRKQIEDEREVAQYPWY